MLLGLLTAQTAAPPAVADLVREAFGDQVGSLVILDPSMDEPIDPFPSESSKQLPPCSTFKIWNSLIGLELGLISAAGEPFHEWDGTVRSIPEWNQDLTLRESFQASCVPAFQVLARRIGQREMDIWLKRLDYGNADTSSGLDVFWLPEEGRSPLLISPREQAERIRRLVTGELGITPKTERVLRELLLARQTARGTLFGKTGTGRIAPHTNVGWYVGWIESGSTLRPFACTLFGKGVMGKDARALVERVFGQAGWL